MDLDILGKSFIKNQKSFHSSVEIFPASSNADVPVIVDFYPFEDDNIKIFQMNASDEIEVCPYCKEFVDSDFTENDDKKMLKCPYCSKLFTPENMFLALEQMSSNSFIHIKPVDIDYHFNLVFVLDSCVEKSYFTPLKDSLFESIEALPDDTDFLLLLVHPKYFECIIVVNGFLVTLNLSCGDFVSNYINVKDLQNRKNSLSIFKEYINRFDIVHDLNPSMSIDDVISCFSNISLKKNDTFLLSRIVLFSSRIPKVNVTKDLFVDMVYPSANPQKTDAINGYFLSLEIYKDTKEQVRSLISKITSEFQIFNVRIEGHAINYQCKESALEYGTALTNFCQTFHLSSKFFNGGLNQAIFIVKMVFVKYDINAKNFLLETIYMKKCYQKSNDFIPIISSINPFVLITHLSNAELNSLIPNLFDKYKKSFSDICIGDSNETSFSTVPHCQWLIISCFSTNNFLPSKYNNIPCYCNINSLFGRFYPNISYWEDPDNCFADRCKFDRLYYELAGRPPIVVVDTVFDIKIFKGNINIPKDSKLDKLLNQISEERFPKPIINKDLPITEYESLLIYTDVLFKKLEKLLKN